MECKRITAIVVATALVAAGCAEDDPPSAPPQTSPTSSAVALTPCAVPKIPTARCGSITVPLDRSHPEAGTTEVAFALVPRANQALPSLGTIVTNPGGPGSGTVDLVGFRYAEGLRPVLDRRDLLLVDPRGVGRSAPISCPSLEDPARVFAAVEVQRAAIGRCGEALGDKAGYYGTAAVADDFDDVRAAVGVDRVDLLGDSYGTYLMTTYAARHPDHVRSVVLSGAYPVNTDHDSSGAFAAAALRRAIGLVCERTTSCSGPTVLADLAALAARLRTAPVAFTVPFEGRSFDVVLDEWQLAGTVGKLYSGAADVETKLALAAALAAARAGDLAPVQELVKAHLLEMASIPAMGVGLVSEPLAWATTCHDYQRDFSYADSAAERQRAFADALARLKAEDFAPFSPKAWVTRDSYDAGACLDWPADPTATAPVAKGTKLADVPVLVLSGDLDANTSTASGEEAAAQFPNARLVEVAGAGHTPTITDEGAKLAMEFIARDHP
ncbi:alpha/beta fold hydrolase [Umezawaea tangerina]|uniref:TAP-like protein n=1 Tax=Umezawaea tangerina TaxID=84725 RepID=A0A2T0STL6_9PSEU|nr:alpha/beta fold hydrolase [Umezawaea tangerina]PRY36738.1 TAP-like protein [Umezawaea tangerina]